MNNSVKYDFQPSEQRLGEQRYNFSLNQGVQSLGSNIMSIQEQISNIEAKNAKIAQ